MNHSDNRLAIGLASLSFATLGVCLILPGALLPLLVEHYGMRPVEAGSMLATQPIGYLLAVAAAGRIIRAIGLAPALSSAFVLAGLAFIGFGSVSSPMAGGAMMFVTGMGIGTIEVAANALLIEVGGKRTATLLNFAHLFFGVGSILTPLLATQAVAAGLSWNAAFITTGVATILVGASWRLVKTPKRSAADLRQADARLHWGYLLFLATTLGLYVGVEMGIGNWLTKFMVGERGLDLTAAGSVLSLYWGGLTAGRLLLIFTAHRFQEERLLVGLTAFSAAAFALALLATSPLVTAVGFILTGVGYSGIFPVVIALGGRAHPDSSAAATSVLIGGAGLGGILVPWVMSAIADGFGLGQGMLFYAAMNVVMFALVVRLQQTPTHQLPLDVHRG